MTTSKTTIAIQWEWIKIIVSFVWLAKNNFLGVLQKFSSLCVPRDGKCWKLPSQTIPRTDMRENIPPKALLTLSRGCPVCSAARTRLHPLPPRVQTLQLLLLSKLGLCLDLCLSHQVDSTRSLLQTVRQGSYKHSDCCGGRRSYAHGQLQRWLGS